LSSNDYIFQANAKVGNHLINIVGVSQEEFQQNLQWVTTNAAGIVSTLAALEAAYTAKPLAPHVADVQVTNTAPGQWADRSYAQGAQQPQQAYQQPAVQQAPPNQAPVPSCQHGAMRLVPGGISKAGNSYKGFYSCTQPRESQCKSVNS
jgi:hypothetical protein